MLSSIVGMFSYDFIVRAFIVGIVISICAALLGVVLVLRRNSMIGDGLSHVAFGAFAIATVLNLTPLYFAIPVAIIVSFLILRLNQNSKIHGDSAIALVSASALAIGVMAISIIKGVNVDINAYLFGSILSVTTSDLVISSVLGCAVILFFATFYHRIFAITIDETFAKSIGLKVNYYQAILATICSIVVVIGMKLLGSLLISSLIIFPCLTSMHLFKNFRQVIISSAVISVICFSVGLIASYLFSTPTGASVVIVNLVAYIICWLTSKLK